MTADLATQLLAQLLWKAVLISAPLLLALLLIGLLVSVIQVVTQIQEMSLTFIPKLMVAVGVLVLIGPWMMGQVVSYSIGLIGGIPARL